MSLWNTILTVNGSFMAHISIKCGIFQGDSISPLLFCLTLNPLSDVLKSTRYGYKVRSEQLVQHLLYMDDLKLYAKSERDLNALITTVSLFSSDIGMTINMTKSAMLLVKRGKVASSEVYSLSNVGSMPYVDVSEGYKYLGVFQDVLLDDDKVKQTVLSEYRSRFRRVLSSHLNGYYKIIALNSYALPVIRYSAGIIKWSQSELDDIDRKSRKLLTIYKGLHPKADVHRLYLPRKVGGRGLLNVKQMVAVETQSLAHYVWRNKNAEPLIFALQECGLFPRPTVSLSEFKASWLQSYLSSWKEKPLHGQFPCRIESVTRVDCAYKWLKLTYLKLETEAFITSAQDQAICTKAYNAKVLRCGDDSTCRLCQSSDETIYHLLSACPALAATEYLKRHNSVASLIHKHICESYGIPTCDKPWLYNPQSIVQTNCVKILWDLDIRTDHVISAHRPDIVVHDFVEHSAMLLDVSIPADFNIVEKEREKIQKYKDLCFELQQIWKLRKIKFIPIVIGVTGSFTKNLQNYLDELPGTHKIGSLLKAAILGSAHLLRRSLSF